MIGPREIRLAVVILSLVLLRWVMKGYRDHALFQGPPIIETLPRDPKILDPSEVHVPPALTDPTLDD